MLVIERPRNKLLSTTADKLILLFLDIFIQAFVDGISQASRGEFDDLGIQPSVTIT